MTKNSESGPNSTIEAVHPPDALALHGQEYAECFDRRHGRRRLLQLLPFIRLEPDDDLVDFGCGNGLLAAEVRDRVRSYTGVDFSEPFIALARRKYAQLGADNLRFEHASIGDFCERHAGRFNVACALDLSEHVPDREWRQLLESIRRSLKHGGRLYLHTPNADFLLEQMKRRNFLLRQSPQHVAVRTSEHNLRLLRDAGYSVDAARFVRHYNILRFLHPLGLVPRLGRLFQARIFIEARAP